MRTACVAHCAGCNSHFSGVAAFDAHRKGDPDERYCVDPMDDPRFALKTEAGTCDLRFGPTRLGVRVWQLASAWDGPDDLTETVSRPPWGVPGSRAA